MSIQLSLLSAYITWKSAQLMCVSSGECGPQAESVCAFKRSASKIKFDKARYLQADILFIGSFARLGSKIYPT